MPNVGPLELIVVLVIALIVLGPKKPPAVGRSLGHGIREFKDSISGMGGHDDHEEQAAAAIEPPEPAATTAATAPAPRTCTAAPAPPAAARDAATGDESRS